MTTAIKAQAMFNNLVTELEKVYGDQMKTNVQLLEIGKAILPEMRDVIRNSDVDLLNKEPQYLIVNTNNRSGLIGSVFTFRERRFSFLIPLHERQQTS